MKPSRVSTKPPRVPTFPVEFSTKPPRVPTKFSKFRTKPPRVPMKPPRETSDETSASLRRNFCVSSRIHRVLRRLHRAFQRLRRACRRLHRICSRYQPRSTMTPTPTQMLPTRAPRTSTDMPTTVCRAETSPTATPLDRKWISSESPQIAAPLTSVLREPRRCFCHAFRDDVLLHWWNVSDPFNVSSRRPLIDCRPRRRARGTALLTGPERIAAVCPAVGKTRRR